MLLLATAFAAPDDTPLNGPTWWDTDAVVVSLTPYEFLGLPDPWLTVGDDLIMVESERHAPDAVCVVPTRAIPTAADRAAVAVEVQTRDT